MKPEPTRVGSKALNLSLKCKDYLKILARGKHSSLFFRRVSEEEKGFYSKLEGELGHVLGQTQLA